MVRVDPGDTVLLRPSPPPHPLLSSLIRPSQPLSPPSSLQVFPQGLSGLLFGGFKGEVWIQPGAQPTRGALYRDKEAGRALNPEGTVSLVLGGHAELRRV